MNKPTWKDLREAALFDPVLHAAVTRYEQGDLTAEEALIWAALELARIRGEQHAQLVKLFSERPAVAITANR